MAYKIETDESGRKTVSFHMDAQRIDALFKEVRREIQKDISIPGFRKGKIPSSILNSRFGNLILSEVAEKAHRELSDMLFDENDWILSDTEPEFKPVLPSEGRDYDYTVTYTLFETPEPRDYSGIEVPVPEFDREKALEEALEEIVNRFVSYDPVERAAGAGDLVVLEYSSRDKGETRRAAVVIGRENMGPGFDEMLPGLSPGDSFAAAMEFPGMEEPLKATTFTVMEVREPRRPELDDEFARSAGGFESMEQLREKVLQSILEKHQAERRAYMEASVIDSLLAANTFQVPGFMVDNLSRDYEKRLEEDEPSPETLRSVRELAERKVREFLLLRQIAIHENVEVDGEELEKAAAGGSRSSALDRLRNEKALDLVISRAVETKAEPPAPHEDTSDEQGWRWVPAGNVPVGEEE